MDRGTWQATVHGGAKSWTQLSDFTSLCFTTESNNTVINCTSIKNNNNKKAKTNKLSQLTRIFELVSGHESAISPDCQLF